MTNYTLTMLDTTGTQDYIFNSNRLQENIGASEIAYRATTLWAFEALGSLSHNIGKMNKQTGEWAFESANPQIEDGQLDVEIIFAGGGNTLLIFQDSEEARAFVSRLTRRLLHDAPGLTVVAQHIDNFEWDSGSLKTAREGLIESLAKHKQQRAPSSPLLGLGVTQPCQSTGLVAVRTDNGKTCVEGKYYSLRVGDQEEEEPRPISREVECKLGWRDFANWRLKHLVGTAYRSDFEFPFDVDYLGRAFGEESYVAVIHADGNQMGENAKNVGSEAKTNREYISKLRGFSQKVKIASGNALRRVVQTLDEATIWDSKRGWLVSEKVPLSVKQGDHRRFTYLPFRPLVFGGDDVTFLANGQLGLALATAYLQAFEAATQKEGLNDGQGFQASAGIAMVKMHYPFARAYRLSEQLTKSAKQLAYDNDDCSALDWHFAISGLSGRLQTIRSREYTLAELGDLIMRPMRLHGQAGNADGRYWLGGYERLTVAVQTNRSNKIKGLRIPLRQGETAVEQYRQTYRMKELPEMPLKSELVDNSYRRTGWKVGRCVYLDAIELIDHYVRLEKAEKEVEI